MPRFLIEVPHKNNKQACNQAIQAFKKTGSHFLANADWGCLDGIHKAWIIIELENKEAALLLIPPWYRQKAEVITLQKLALDKPNEAFKQHKV